MDDKYGKLTMKEATNELASFILSLNLGSEEMPIEEYVQLAGEEIVDARYNIVELVDVAWSRKVHLDLNLNEETMEGNDVHDQPIPIVKLSQAHEYAQLLSNLSILRSFQ